MCGIAGYITRAHTSEAPTLGRMLAQIESRGPDGAGEWRAQTGPWQIAFGHRRLAIIDLAGGAQPLHAAGNQISVTFNGEIYNFIEIRSRLQSQGYDFKTNSDTEVLANNYHAQGLDSVPLLNGMFAFALWDHRTQELTLARDRFGVKPLYYASTADGGLVFASELSAVLAHPGVARAIDLDALATYFFRDYIPAPCSLISGVKKLLPGHTLRWKDGELDVPNRFWSLPDVQEFRPSAQSDEALARQLFVLLDQSVGSQLVSDVPLGIFLSGGIDSSAIAALAQRYCSTPVRTFSIGFKDPSYDESAFAREAARYIGAEHCEEILSEDNLLEVIQGALTRLDEPLADASLIPTYLLSRLAVRHVKVALGGDGGDELWAGYPTYRAHRWAEVYARIPRWIRKYGIEPVVSALPVQDRYQSFEWKAKRFVQLWDEDPLQRHFRWMSATDIDDLKTLLEPRPFRLPWNERHCIPPSQLRQNRFLCYDFLGYMPGSVLTKVDRASMAWSLEVRPPFLDNALVDWAFSLPNHVKLRGSQGKFLLKKALTGLLPETILHRKKKGFGIPVGTWLRGPLKGDVESALRTSPLWDLPLHREVFQKWNEEHQNRSKDHAKRLWALIVVDRWLRNVERLEPAKRRDSRPALQVVSEVVSS